MRAPATAARSEAHWASRPPAGARGGARVWLAHAAESYSAMKKKEAPRPTTAWVMDRAR